MENFTFHNPTKLIFGKGTIPKIGFELSKAGISKVLLLAGGGSIRKNGVYDQVTKSLKDEEIIWKELWGVQPNPVLTHAEKAIEIARKEKVDAILAVGGGSVIDEAKSVAAGVHLKNLWSAFERRAPIKKALPVFTILTISATCSEMDPYSVLTNEKLKRKWNIGGPALYPKVSIVDPEVQMGLPWRQTVNGAVDALSHIMEFYFLGTNEEITISVNEAMMRTIISSTDILQNDEKDYNARANLAWSATMALNGVSGVAMKGGDWAVHAIEHGLSALKPEVAHGEGLAVLFPAWIRYMSKLNTEHFTRWAKNVWEANSIDEGIGKMKEKYAEWKAPVTLRELGFDESSLPHIIDNVMERNEVGVLKKLNNNDIMSILKFAY